MRLTEDVKDEKFENPWYIFLFRALNRTSLHNRRAEIHHEVLNSPVALVLFQLVTCTILKILFGIESIILEEIEKYERKEVHL